MGQSRRAFDSGFVGELSWSSKWNRWKMDICHRGSSAFEKWKKRDSAVMYRPIVDRRSVSRGTTFLMWRQRPQIQNASITGQPTCSYDTYEKNDLALQLFFSPPRQLLRFDFNAFLCSFVFSCKNLTVLECLYFIKCVNFFGYYTLELL